MSSLRSGGNYAVIGGGFAGLAVCNHIINKLPTASITLFDLNGKIGHNSASAVAGGLMHPFTPKGKIIWKGLEGYQSSLQLLQSCQPYIPHTNIPHSSSSSTSSSQPMNTDSNENIVYKNQKILRPCYKEEDFSRWKDSSIKYPELLEVVDKQYIQSITGCTQSLGGVLFKQSMIVNPPFYLQALWNRIQSLSPKSNWKTQHISVTDLENMSQFYDDIIITAGPGIKELWSQSIGCSSSSSSSSKNQQLPFKYVRGQNLIYQYKNKNSNKRDNTHTDNLDTSSSSSSGSSSSGSNGGSNHNDSISSSDELQLPVLRGEYIIPLYYQSHKLLIGATHEYYPTLEDIPLIPQPESAVQLLSAKLTSMYPYLFEKYDLDHGNTGIRVVSERSNLGKLPVLDQHTNYKNIWMFSGLGARGLIHHAYLSEILANAVIAKDVTLIPSELRL